jgi:hypothetical protein
MQIIICDVDGTIANIDHRKHYLEQKPKNWDAFYEACDGDLPKDEICQLLNCMEEAGYVVIYVSGRRESTRGKTKRWIDRHGFPPGDLLMRAEGDFRSDVIVKREIYERELKQHFVLFVLDDRSSVVAMWRDLGLTCLQVAPGDF